MNAPRTPSSEAGPGPIRPMPGGRPVPRQAATAQEGTVSRSVPITAEPAAPYALPAASPNALLAAASPLLSIAPQIRQSASYPDPHRLKEDLTHGLRRFEQQAEEAGVSHAHVIAARYVLCTFLDECAASTPWGSAGIWAADTLLVRLHSETWGGEKVFQLLSRLAKEPAANIDVLELIYVCIALGFEGRYRVVDNGRSQLETLRERLYQLIRNQRGQADATLSAQWQPARTEAGRWFELTPMWVFLTLCVAAALTAFLTYRTLLNVRSDPAFSLMQAMRAAPALAPVAARPAQPAPAPAVEPQLARFLAPEIAAGLVAVRETPDKRVVTIRGDGLFAPGSATVNQQVLPLLSRIALALQEQPGTVIVSGHTDSQPIRSVRFPSNYHLSQERAAGVARILEATIGTARVRSEGRADAEPVAPNDTSANRARNRRVTLTLLNDQPRLP